MLLATVGIIVGLVVLTWSADAFVVGATRLSAALRLSPVVIGAVVIGFGTSAPELLVSVLAAAQGSLDLAVGNLVGSNIANLTLVLGVAAVLSPVRVQPPTVRREAPLSLVSVVVLAIVIQRPAGPFGAAVLAAVMAAALVVIVRAGRVDHDRHTGEVAEQLDAGASVARELGRTAVGLIGTLVAAQLLVVSASSLARGLGLSEGFIGLTVVAVGTSLPELATAVQAARRAQTELLIGNLLGSNLFNSGAVGAAAVLAGTGQQVGSTIAVTGSLLMVVVATAATLFMVTGHRVVRAEGVVLLAAYAVTLPLVAG